MNERTKALLVHHNSETLTMLQGALMRQGMNITQAGSRAQAKRLLGGLNPVPLVFTDTQLPDGTWSDILSVAEKSAKPVNVIVVARVADTRFYVEVIEAGAYDFITPPFNDTDLAYVVRSALNNVASRREAATSRRHLASGSALAEVHEEGSIHASTT